MTLPRRPVSLSAGAFGLAALAAVMVSWKVRAQAGAIAAG